MRTRRGTEYERKSGTELKCLSAKGTVESGTILVALE